MSSGTDNAGKYYGPGDYDEMIRDMLSNAEDEIKSIDQTILRMQERRKVLTNFIEGSK